MIFFFLTSYWLIVARTPMEFIIPSVLIAIRMAYVSRGVKISMIPTITLLVMIYLVTFWTLDTEKALLIAVRVGLLIALFSQIGSGPRSVVVSEILSFKPLAGIAYFVYFLGRFRALMQKRFSDVQYTVSVRMSRERMSIWGKMCLIARGMTSLVFEVTYIIDQVSLVTSARGEVPATARWMSKPASSWTIPIGDAVLYASVCGSILINKSLFPADIWTYVSRLK